MPLKKRVSEGILAIQQWSRKATTYALEFWNKSALKAVFWMGLNEDMRTEMSCRDNEASLDSLIDLAIRLDNHLHDECTI